MVSWRDGWRLIISVELPSLWEGVYYVWSEVQSNGFTCFDEFCLTNQLQTRSQRIFTAQLPDPKIKG